MTDNPNLVVVEIGSYVINDSYSVIERIKISVNRVQVFTYTPTNLEFPNFLNIKYISFVASDDGKKDEFFIKKSYGTFNFINSNLFRVNYTWLRIFKYMYNLIKKIFKDKKLSSLEWYEKKKELINSWYLANSNVFRV